MDNQYDIFGYIGAGFLTLLMIPQVYHCFSNKTSTGLTISFITLQFLTSIFFLIYGFFVFQLPILIANISTLIGTILLAIAKILYKD